MVEPAQAEPTEPGSLPRYLLLGPPGVRELGRGEGAGQVRVLRGRRQNLLFATLALRPGVPLQTDVLLEALWDDQLPADPTGALQSQVSRLRLFLGGSIVAGTGTYELTADPGEVDALRFDEQVRAARQLRDGGAYAHARQVADQALALWRGRPFAELGECDLADDESRRLEDLRLEAYLVRAESDVALGRTTYAAITLRTLTGAYPLREDLWAALVRALYVGGRTSEALAAYRKARRTLVRELGLEPGPLLRGLEAAILRGDADLLAAQHPCSAHAQLLAATPHPVRLLAFPAGEPGGEEAHLQPGVRLFLDRVRTSFPEYDPDRQEIVLAARLVRLLRGDPVAIELAAQQLPSRSVHDLVELHERVAGGQGIPGRSPEVGG